MQILNWDIFLKDYTYVCCKKNEELRFLLDECLIKKMFDLTKEDVDFTLSERKKEYSFFDMTGILFFLNVKDMIYYSCDTMSKFRENHLHAKVLFFEQIFIKKIKENKNELC